MLPLGCYDMVPTGTNYTKTMANTIIFKDLSNNYWAYIISIGTQTAAAANTLTFPLSMVANQTLACTDSGNDNATKRCRTEGGATIVCNFAGNVTNISISGLVKLTAKPSWIE